MSVWLELCKQIPLCAALTLQDDTNLYLSKFCKIHMYGISESVEKVISGSVFAKL
jgi:hypothetical protein